MKKLKIDHNLYINYRQQKTDRKNAPTIIFLHGLMSDINGTKALSIEKYCIENSYNFVVFDNLGHGESSGKFTDYGISSWFECTKKVIKELNLTNIILIGSSMGGWLAILVALERMKEVNALILLAPAPDFTSNIWEKLSDNKKEKLLNNEIINIKETSEHPGIPISYKIIEDSKNHLLLDKPVVKLEIPIIIIHGMKDNDVNYKLAQLLVHKISSPSLVFKLIKYAGHRLSNLEDLHLINHSINEIINFLHCI